MAGIGIPQESVDSSALESNGSLISEVGGLDITGMEGGAEDEDDETADGPTEEVREDPSGVIF